MQPKTKGIHLLSAEVLKLQSLANATETELRNINNDTSYLPIQLFSY